MVHCMTLLKFGPQLREVEKLGEGASSAVENYTHDCALRLESCREIPTEFRGSTSMWLLKGIVILLLF